MAMSSAERSARYRAKDVDAYRARKREYATTPEQREVRRLYMQKWRETNRQKHNTQARESYRRHRESRLRGSMEAHYRDKYGMSIEAKAEMIAAQQGVCLICIEPFKSQRSAHIDHCHKTGRVRGILCHRCNTKLGWLETYRDSIEGYLSR